MNESATARAQGLFARVYGRGEGVARNFMTPGVIRYGVAGPYAYELSSGTGFFGHLYGVTVLRLDGLKCHSLSKAFSSLDEAEQHIKQLRSGFGADTNEENG